VAAVVNASSVPILPGARPLAEAGHVPGGSARNLADLADSVTFAESVEGVTRTLLCDAQTSGGLLMCVAPERLDGLLERLRGRTPALAVVGEVVEGEAGQIRVR